MATRAIQKGNNYKNWEEIPHAILGELVKKQPWFTGTVDYDIEKTVWDSKQNQPGWNGRGFTAITVKPIVLGTEVRIQVRWDHTYGFDLFVPYPCVSEKWHTPHGGCKHFFSNNYEGALKRIKSAMEAMTPACQEKKRENDEQKQKELLKARQIKEVGKLFGVELKERRYGDAMQYNASANYSMSFFRKDNANFTIGDIYGEFTKEEIQTILDVIRNSPRVMADRLTNGK